MMTRLLTVAAIVATLSAVAFTTTTKAIACDKCAAHNPPKTEAKPNVAPEGWTRLFDGESLVGWTVLSGKAEYDVVDGTIKGTTRKGSPNTFLCTTKEYGDFELQFETFLHDRQLNSGVQIRSIIVNDQKGNYGGRIGGPQVEIASNGNSGFIYGEASTRRWMTENVKELNHKHFKLDQWNKYHVIAKGNTITTKINGHEIAKTVLPDDFQQKFSKGVIGLQVHSVGGDPNWTVSWRNIYIKELK